MKEYHEELTWISALFLTIALFCIASWAAGCANAGTPPVAPTPTPHVESGLQPDSLLRYISLEAVRTYEPAAWENDEVVLTEPIMVQIPRYLPVVTGHPGRGSVELYFGSTGCVYDARPMTARYEQSWCADEFKWGDTIAASYFKLYIVEGLGEDDMYRPDPRKGEA